MSPVVKVRRRVAGVVALSAVAAAVGVGVAPPASAAESVLVTLTGNPCTAAGQTLSHWRTTIDGGWSGTLWAGSARSVWTTLPAGEHRFVVDAWCADAFFTWIPARGAAASRWIGTPAYTYVVLPAGIVSG